MLLLSVIGVSTLVVGSAASIAALGDEGRLIRGHTIEARLFRRRLIVGQIAVLAIV